MAEKPSRKIPTGLSGFDHISRGGLMRGRTTLVSGSSGSGKTLFSMEVIVNQIRLYDRTAVFVTMEENVDDLLFNFETLPWNLDELCREKKLEFVDSSPTLEATAEIGAANLEGLLIQIKHAVESVGASFVVMDSVGSLFSQFTDSSVIRRELSRVIHNMKALGVTTLMTAERVEEYGGISRYGIEEFVSDSVIILRHVLEQERVRRTIQIMKMRGDAHDTGEFPFTISERGFNLLPLSAMELKQPSSKKRLSSGNAALDGLTNGGLFRDAIILVSGPTGGGKTLLGITFAAEACRQGEKVLLLAYEESQPQLLRNAQEWGLDFEEWEHEGLLKIVCVYPESMPLEHHLLTVQKTLEEFKPRRLVMDSVSALERAASIRTFREFVIGLTSFCKKQEVCSMLTATTPRLSGGDSVTEAHISTITDCIILLRYVEINGFMRRGITVIKMRGSQHDKQIHEFIIDETGMVIQKPFENVQNIVLGIPFTSGAASEPEQLEALFGRE